ncbi:MAG: pyrimidine-nucleoside phosphorylase [bacterium]
MRMVDLIEKKKNGLELTKEEINYVIEGYTKGEIEDYQVSALAMAIYFQKMSEEEATNLAMAMLKSGDELDLSSIEGIKVDKHSTGGVGDKTSLVLAPMVAAVGAKVAKMSGRGLGHTGGTIDKLESIKGFNVAISNEDFFNIVNKCGLSLIGQTGNLCPADKKLYALRDVTATVDIIPLIASSIMSKKLASGSDCIVLDVKVGSGAFMKTVEQATELAELMVKIGRNCGRKMTAVLTDMDEPLGCTVGNALEVIEAIETLQNKGPHDLTELCIETGSFLVVDAQITDDLNKAKELLRESLKNGTALQKFREMVELQGGDVSYIDDITNFDKAKNIIEVKSSVQGYVQTIDALAVGIASMKLGGGRESMKDVIDMGVGVVLNKKIGDKVEVGEVLAFVHANDKNAEDACKMVFEAYNITNTKTEKKIILKTIR